MTGGYWGKILTVDLTSGEVAVDELAEATARQYIGGSGLGARFLHDLTDGKTDPLGPENALIFMTGPLVGTGVYTSGRHAIVSKSPLTGIFTETDVGGSWGTKFKATGFDGLIITGRARHPVYLWIQDNTVEIRDASHVWGKDTYAADEILKSETNPAAVTAVIGPAGERLVRLAAILHDGKDARAGARGGPGAVMGSKNLKAVVVNGSQRVPVKDSRALAESLKAALPIIKEKTASFHEFGTSGGVTTHESYGNFPLQNWRLGRWDKVTNISGAKMVETILTDRYACRSCPIGCGRVVKITEGAYAGVDGAGPEYESIGALGGMTLVDSLPAIAMANQLCNQFGLDTISTGAAIAFAMEAFERGIITVADTGGLRLDWGSAEALVELVRQMGERKGLGQLLGEGVRIAAARLGKGAEEFAIHVKGLEPPAHDPRAYNGMAVAYATSARGACHLSAFTHMFERTVAMPDLGYNEPHQRHAVEGKGEFVAKMQNLMGLFDSLKVCKFILFGSIQPHQLIEWLGLVTGWDVTFDEMLVTGERIFNLKRLYNVACGISRKDDTLPQRFLKEERVGKDLIVNLPPLDVMLDDYYAFRGWTPDGIPTEERLRALGL